MGSADTQGTGSRKSKEYDLGVGSNKSSIDLTSRELADSSNTLLGSANTQRTGANKSSEYNSGLGSNKWSIDSTSRQLSNAANAGMGSADTGATGENQGRQYVSGLESNEWGANLAGTLLSEEANSGARSYDGYGPGSDFGAGFINGIESWIGRAAVAGANIAINALNAARRSLDEHSPSRKMRKVGRYFSEGFALGIEDEEKMAKKASENLSKIALNSMDMPEITARMHEVMAMNTNRVTRQITSQNIHVQHMISDERDRLSDKEVQAIGKAVAEVMNDRMEEFKFVINSREFGRAVREVKK